jgi:endonuclease/exonuclease/phosphatase family metal-dependent hydrolase
MLTCKTYPLLCALLAAGFFAQAQGVTCTPGRIAFTERVAVGSTSPSQRFTVAAHNLIGGIVVQPCSQVEASLTDSAYSRSPLVIPAQELADSGSKAVYVRFAPTCSGFADSAVSASVILLNQHNELLGSVTVTGVVQQEDATGGLSFKFATFNAAWLGCPSYGPSDESLQMSNAATLISGINADVVALQEVTNSPNKSLDTVLKHLGSAWGGHVVPYSQASCAQSEAIVYKKDRISLIGTPSLMTAAGTYDAWSSGRYPVQFSLDLNAGTRSIPVTLINLHAKAYSDADGYSRRTEASQGLKALLDGSEYAAKNLVVLGDYNDDVETSTYGNLPSPYKNFADDTLSYRFLLSQISESAQQIDHIMVSNELFPFYVSGSAQLEAGVAGGIPSYDTTTSDHIPVSATLAFGKQRQEMPVADHYSVRLEDRSLEMPAYSDENLPLRYAIDSGVVASLKDCTLTLFDTGTVRMVAWQLGNAAFVPVAKFFYVQATDRSVAPKIVVQPASLKVALRESAVFTVQATGTNLRYRWKKDGKEVAGATSFRYAIGKAVNSHIGYYSCEVSNDMGSEESQAAQLCVNAMCPTTAAGKNALERRLKIYPNPARQSFSVESAAGNITSLRVCSITGAVVYEQKNICTATLNVPTLGWSAGVYVLTATSDRGEKTVGKILIATYDF